MSIAGSLIDYIQADDEYESILDSAKKDGLIQAVDTFTTDDGHRGAAIACSDGSILLVKQKNEGDHWGIEFAELQGISDLLTYEYCRQLKVVNWARTIRDGLIKYAKKHSEEEKST